MKFHPLPLSGAFEITLDRIEDARGFFARCYCDDEFGQAGLNTTWPQMNVSMNVQPGTLRGLHFQRAPAEEIKLVRCMSGEALDVIVDLREGSETFGQHCSITLDGNGMNAVYIPQGFAHGFQTLAPNTLLHYLHSTAYAPGHEGGVNAQDPDLAINWPLAITSLSERDTALPPLHEIPAL